MKNIKLLVTFGVFGVIPSYLVIILLKICALGKYIILMSKIFFRTKNLNTSIKIPILGSVSRISFYYFGPVRHEIMTYGFCTAGVSQRTTISLTCQIFRRIRASKRLVHRYIVNRLKTYAWICLRQDTSRN